MTGGSAIKNCKERGEWAELCFMAKAAGHGLRVSKPYGDSASYDVGVEREGRILRVQVKSTLYRRRGIESYSLNVHGPRRQRYKKGTVDFFAVYLIPPAIAANGRMYHVSRGISVCILRRAGSGGSGSGIGRLGSCWAGRGLKELWEQKYEGPGSHPGR